MNTEFLKTQVARAAIRVPNKFKEIYRGKEFLVVGRPGGSNIAEYGRSFPGGLIREVDFSQLIDPDKLHDPNFIPDEDLLIQAGLIAADRTLEKEVQLAAVGLMYYDHKINPEGYDTYLYVRDLDPKPRVSVDPEGSGSDWMSEQDFRKQDEATGEYRHTDASLNMLSGHVDLGRWAIAALDSIAADTK